MSDELLRRRVALARNIRTPERLWRIGDRFTVIGVDEGGESYTVRSLAILGPDGMIYGLKREDLATLESVPFPAEQSFIAKVFDFMRGLPARPITRGELLHLSDRPTPAGRRRHIAQALQFLARKDFIRFDRRDGWRVLDKQGKQE
jgi:hypothetical protein